MLREGRTYEKAAAMFALAAGKKPANPDYHIGLGCAPCVAGRVNRVRGDVYANADLGAGDYPEKLKKWENGRAEFENNEGPRPGRDGQNEL